MTKSIAPSDLVTALRRAVVARRADGKVVEAVASYFREFQAAGRSPATLRSYGMGLLRWFRFLWAAEVAWDRATVRRALRAHS